MINTNDQNEVAKILIDIGSIKFSFDKHFVLTSGKKSPVYVDCRKIISFVEERNKILNIVNDQIGTPNHAWFIGKITIKILKKIIKKPELNPKVLNVSARGYTSCYNFAKKIKKSLVSKYQDRKLIPISTKDLSKIVKDYSKMKRPLNSILNINKLESFLEEKMPNWEIIFKKKISKIVKNYSNNN